MLTTRGLTRAMRDDVSRNDRYQLTHDSSRNAEKQYSTRNSFSSNHSRKTEGKILRLHCTPSANAIYIKLDNVNSIINRRVHFNRIVIFCNLFSVH